MDYLYTARANERIRSGNLPHCSLEKDLSIPAISFDFHAQCEDVLMVLNDIFPYIGTSLRMAINLLSELKALHKPLNFVHDVNLLINTGFNPRSINIEGPAAKKAIQLCPCVTDIDKALRMVIELFGKSINLVSDDSKNEAIGIFFTWLYLLKVVQNNEHTSGKTLNLSVIDDDALLLDLLSSSWTASHNNYLVDLSIEEKQDLEELFVARADIKNSISKECSIASSVARETEASWDLFLEMLNDLSNREFFAVDQVCADIPPDEKLICIRQYISLFEDIKLGHYTIKGVSHECSSLIEAVKKRMDQAAAYCNVQDSLGLSFRLCPEAIDLLAHPLTFNFLLLAYHQFRLEHNYNNALYFSNLALNCLNRNFLIYDEVRHNSIEAVVEEFGKTFLTPARNCQSSIRELSFDSVQQDFVATGLPALSAVAFDHYNNHLSSKIKAAEIAIQEKGIEDYYKEAQETRYTKEQIEAAVSEDNQAIEKSATATVAHQVVVSLNIAYLLCDALKIMQSFNHKYVYFADESLVDQYIADLEWEIDQVSCAVYTKEAKVKKFRESKGIDAKLLSVRETAEAKIQSDTFAYSILATLEELAEKVDSLDIDGLMYLSVSIRSKIRKHTICNLTEDLTERLIAISARICNRLIALCKSTILDYDLMRQALISNLGIETEFLPPSVLDSLATAELLYQQYASLKYAEKHFDYSSISALYYQAFEDAYNQLIWSRYADKLNSLPIGSRLYTDILSEYNHSNIPIPEAKGYLFQPLDTRRCYTEYDKLTKRVTVKPFCMYKHFVTLMEEVNPDSRVRMFCNYYAKLAGFKNRYAMFTDSNYMERLFKFVKDVDRSVFNRNNASHGGSPILIDQCIKDKQTVLSEIEAVRDNSIGLIQQLLYLLKNSKTLPKYNH